MKIQLMLYKKVKKYYRRHGLFKVILICLDKIGFKFYFRTMFFYLKDISEKEGQAPNAHKTALNIEEIVSSSEIEKIEDYFDGWRDKEEAIKRLSSERRLFIVRALDKICSFVWIDTIFSEVPCLNLNFILPSGTASVAYTYTKPEFRKRGANSFAIRSLKELLKKEGIKRIIAFVDPKNIASRKVKEKMGFKISTKCVYIRIIFLKIYIFTQPQGKKGRILIVLGWDENRAIDIFSRNFNVLREKGKIFNPAFGEL